MNIKEAKQELLQTIQVYTRKDSNGHYLLPSVRQRPILVRNLAECAGRKSYQV